MNKPNYIKVTDVAAMVCGPTLEEAVNEAIEMAKELGCTVTFKFNGITVCVDEWDDVDVAGFRYSRASEQSRMERV